MPTSPGRMPVLFIGHGSPMNALERNPWTEAWRALGRALPRPRAILAISAHWYVPFTGVTAAEQPRTIHDFRGFPPELGAFRYPAPGSPALADRVRDLLAPVPVTAADDWGLDHGTWSVLAHVYPHADVPVVQLGIDSRQPAAWHYAAAARLAALRDEGVLIFASGNIVHNLGMIDWRNDAPPFDWALEFDQVVRGHIERREHRALIDYTTLGNGAQLAVPTPEHYLPLLYALGIQDDRDRVSFPVAGIALGSIGMRAMRIGAQ